MPLRIPDVGLQLESSAEGVATLPFQAFPVTLSDRMLEDMIQCVQNGEDLQLSLGNTPAFLCGSSVHRLPKIDPPAFDLYLTEPAESSKKAEKLPNPTMSLFSRPSPDLVAKARKAAAAKKERGAPARPAGSSRSLDPAIEALQNSLAQANAEKLENSTTVANAYISDKPERKRAGKGKMMPGGKGSLGAAIARSRPASPALSYTGSPSLGPTLSASQQAAQKSREQRSTIIHELAARERTYEELHDKWQGDSEVEFKTVLEKAADFDSNLQKYVLKKFGWRELDVFRYPYASSEERQQAIDNAVKQYDKMRMGASEPEWQRLLPRDERGKGRCLSKLQASIARGISAPVARTPKITVQDADDSSAGSGRNADGDRSGAEGKRPAKGGEPMARLSSQSSQTGKKKVSASEAQAKRLLSGAKKSTPKTSPTKTAAKAGGAKDKKEGRVLSKEFISESDSSSEEAPLSATVPRPRPVEKPREKEAKPKEARDKVARGRENRDSEPREKEVHVRVAPPKPRPAAAKEQIKAQVVAKPAKRAREDDDDSSSSGTPLSKRFKTRPEIKAAAAAAAPAAHKHRASDASQNSRGTAATTSSSSSLSLSNGKPKNTSPAKSSPLASSPPTNASDLENGNSGTNRRAEEERVAAAAAAAAPTKKRKVAASTGYDDTSSDGRPSKRLPTDALEMSRTFKVYYKRYEMKHYEIVGMDDPPEGMILDLMEMRQRLENMKREIHRKVAMAS